jgi:hypothetical protein
MVKRSCADNVTGLKPVTEAADWRVLRIPPLVGEHSHSGEAVARAMVDG